MSSHSKSARSGSKDSDFEKQKTKFLLGLDALSRETGIEIVGCGCCDSPRLESLDEEHPHKLSGYVSDDGVRVTWTDYHELISDYRIGVIDREEFDAKKKSLLKGKPNPHDIEKEERKIHSRILAETEAKENLPPTDEEVIRSCEHDYHKIQFQADGGVVVYTDLYKQCRTCGIYLHKNGKHFKTVPENFIGRYPEFGNQSKQITAQDVEEYLESHNQNNLQMSQDEEE